MSGVPGTDATTGTRGHWVSGRHPLVRAFVVVALTEGVEPALLRAQAARRGAGGLALELAMHPFMGGASVPG